MEHVGPVGRRLGIHYHDLIRFGGYLGHLGIILTLLGVILAFLVGATLAILTGRFFGHRWNNFGQSSLFCGTSFVATFGTILGVILTILGSSRSS